MVIVEGQRSGLLILRVNVEPQLVDRLRIHVRLTRDVSHGFDSTRSVTEIDDAVDLVREWLGAMAAEEGPEPS
jgi:hypothetical protein